MELALGNNMTSLEWPNETYSDYYDLDSNTSAVNISSAAESDDGPYPMVQAVLDFLNLYYLGALIIVGLLGNGKNVVAFILNRNELRSPSYYLASLALADVVFLITILFLWLGQFKIYLFTQAGFYQTLFYLSSVSSCVSAWMIAAFTFERLIVVRYPLKRVKICTVRRAKIIIFCLTAGAFIFQVVSLFPTGVINKKGKGTHASRLPFYYEMMRILSMIETAFTLVIPPVIIVFLNGFIIHDLFKFNQTFKMGSSKHRSTASSTIAKTPQRIQEDIQMLTFSDTKKSQQYPVTSMSVDNEGIKNDHTITEGTEAITQDNNVSDHHSFSSETSSNNAIQYVHTLAIVEDRQCSSAPVINLPSNQTNHHQCLSMATSLMVNGDSESIKEASRPEPSFYDGRNEIRHPSRRDDDPIIITQPLDMEAIEMDTLSAPADDTEAQTAGIEQQHEPICTRICKAFKFNCSKKRTTSTEYSITKKLVLISTVHILLNLPSYGFNLKHFIDETIASSSNVQTSWMVWYLQQFSMVLYYTSFSINFLLYPNSSNLHFNLKFLISCWRKLSPERLSRL